MVYKFELPPELMGRMVKIRKRTKKPLARQVREAVKEYCDKEEKQKRTNHKSLYEEALINYADLNVLSKEECERIKRLHEEDEGRKKNESNKAHENSEM